MGLGIDAAETMKKYSSCISYLKIFLVDQNGHSIITPNLITIYSDIQLISIYFLKFLLLINLQSKYKI